MKSIFKFLFIFTVVFFSQYVVAAGPVPYSSLSGNVSLFDSDPGNGESWGRIGGRNWTYSGFDLLAYTSLRWSVVDSSSVGIAFDGTINTGSSEELSLSSVSGNIAVWNGATQVFLVTTGAMAAVETRFTLALTSNNSPVPFSVNNSNGLPFVDVLALAAPFTLNLRMEARLQGTSTWEPALDLFDRLATDPNGDGLIRTSLFSGFFFELAGGGLTLEEHDAHMVDQSNNLASDIDFLKGETVGRLSQIMDKSQVLEQLIRQIPIPEQNGPQAPTADEIRNIVSERVNELTQILIFLWGVDTSQGPPDPSSVTLIKDLAKQAQLESVEQQLTVLQQQLVAIEQRIVAQKAPLNMVLEIVSKDSDRHGSGRMLLLAKVNGLPVAASIQEVRAVATQHNSPGTVVNVPFTVHELAPGLMELRLEDSHHGRKYKNLVIRAQHQDSEGQLHYDTRLFSEAPFREK